MKGGYNQPRMPRKTLVKSVQMFKEGLISRTTTGTPLLVGCLMQSCTGELSNEIAEAGGPGHGAVSDSGREVTEHRHTEVVVRIASQVQLTGTRIFW